MGILLPKLIYLLRVWYSGDNRTPNVSCSNDCITPLVVVLSAGVMADAQIHYNFKNNPICCTECRFFVVVRMYLDLKYRFANKDKSIRKCTLTCLEMWAPECQWLFKCSWTRREQSPLCHDPLTKRNEEMQENTSKLEFMTTNDGNSGMTFNSGREDRETQGLYTGRKLDN